MGHLNKKIKYFDPELEERFLKGILNSQSSTQLS